MTFDSRVVWVATFEPYHDNSTVIGVAQGLEGARGRCEKAHQETWPDRKVAPLVWEDRSDDDGDEQVWHGTDANGDYYQVKAFPL